MLMGHNDNLQMSNIYGCSADADICPFTKLHHIFTGAGLLEDGLSLQEKRQLCDFLADSCSSAQHEEQKRQQQHQYDPTQQQEGAQQLSEHDNADTLDSLNIEEVCMYGH